MVTPVLLLATCNRVLQAAVWAAVSLEAAWLSQTQQTLIRCPSRAPFSEPLHRRLLQLARARGCTAAFEVFGGLLLAPFLYAVVFVEAAVGAGAAWASAVFLLDGFAAGWAAL